jgi:hypothetical protein
VSEVQKSDCDSFTEFQVEHFIYRYIISNYRFPGNLVQCNMDDYDIKWTDHSEEALEVVHRLQREERFADVSVFCENEVFRAHKVILSACSSYFENVFTRLPDNSTPNAALILRDTHPDLFRMVLDFIYSGEVQVPSAKLRDFMSFAGSLEIRGLRHETQGKISRDPLADKDPEYKPSAAKKAKTVSAAKTAKIVPTTKLLNITVEAAKRPSPLKGKQSGSQIAEVNSHKSTIITARFKRILLT